MTSGPASLARNSIAVSRRNGVKSLEPTLHFGELGEPPVGALLHQRLNGPDYPVGVPRALGRVEEDFELRLRGDVPPRAGHSVAVALQNPAPLCRWEPEEERGQAVAERAPAHPVPIDEPRPQPLGRGDHEDVDRPEIAVKQRVRPGRLVEYVRPSRRVGEEVYQPPE